MKTVRKPAAWVLLKSRSALPKESTATGFLLLWLTKGACIPLASVHVETAPGCMVLD